LGKVYRRYAADRHRVLNWIGIRRPAVAEDWALRGIDFAVAEGESVGIVGRNGAGKSTMLKLITGTQRPTEGHVVVKGQVAAILELGMGFNPEFSGRDNARHALGLMGFDTRTTQRLLPLVEDFAEIGAHFDQPMRTYSSGMYMRVAFAVVTAHQPDLLIVDEALAVGDAYFQHKCLLRMQQFRDAGTSILFVSHDNGSVLNLCDRAILLDSGRMLGSGDPRSVLDQYNSVISRQEGERAAQQRRRGVSRYGNGRAATECITIGNDQGPGDTFVVGDAIWIRLQFSVTEPLDELTLGFMIRDRFGNEVFGTNTRHLSLPLRQLSVDTPHIVQFDIPRLSLGPGDYHLTVALHRGMEHSVENYDWWDAAAGFSVVARPDYVFAGIAELLVTPRLLTAAEAESNS
jgi:lipopolysaccharide transport system ATP-binding protein